MATIFVFLYIECHSIITRLFQTYFRGQLALLASDEDLPKLVETSQVVTSKQPSLKYFNKMLNKTFKKKIETSV